MGPVTVATENKAIVCRLHVKKVESVKANLFGLNGIFSQIKGSSILGGNAAQTSANRFSYWTGEPKDIFEFKDGGKEPFRKLKKNLSKYNIRIHLLQP